MERAELKSLLRATGVAEECGAFFFVRDPQRVERLPAEVGSASAREGYGWLGLPTGGTSGRSRFARHDEVTLTTAVRGFCAHFGFERVNAVGVLPAYHVSGLMARVRCAATQGSYVAWEWKQLELGKVPVLDRQTGDWVLSLVPTQLQRLLAWPTAVAWLRTFRVIFIGGGPVWPALAEAAAQAELPLSLSYGMTETAAMVTALRPDEFLSGNRSSGQALPHARVSINVDGTVSVAGESVFHGYFPEWLPAREFQTEDNGNMDAHGHLHLTGRRDAVIITGGKKVQPTEVEAALRASGEFSDVAVLGVPDAEWGQVVVACYPEGGRMPDFARAVVALAGANKPKRFVAIRDWPRSALGKINRAALAMAVASSLVSEGPREKADGAKRCV
jgi:O-succinylbenzoic acid--CoA ligase